MKLKPSLKQKKRYVVFEISNSSAKKFNSEQACKGLEKGLLDFFGVWGLSLASPMILPETFDKSKQRVVVMVKHKYVDELKVSLAMVNKIAGVEASVRSIISSGTLKTAKEKGQIKKK